MKHSNEQAFQVVVELIRAEKAGLFRPIPDEQGKLGDFDRVKELADQTAKVHAIYIRRLLDELTAPTACDPTSLEP